jgi:hypothetical protein
MLLPNLVVVEDIVDKFAWNWLLSEPDSGVCTLVAGVATADVTTLVWINAVAGLRWLEPQWLTNLWQVLGA